MSKSTIILSIVFTVFEFVLLVVLVWGLALEDVTSKWTGFCVGLGSCEVLMHIVKNVVELCKKE